MTAHHGAFKAAGWTRQQSFLARLLWVGLLASLATRAAGGKPKKYGQHTSKVHWKRESECAKTTCKGFHSDENEDCTSRCVSEPCYEEVYASMPLEPGEVDKARQSKFNICVRKEFDEENKRKAEERRKK
mmetsp:Transcript_130723/g.279564  ORF Transcript_130723/g.279564 Transcript_130723/m.279564 type:complete len:130 (+) Transcript_130723:83-472(+)